MSAPVRSVRGEAARQRGEALLLALFVLLLLGVSLALLALSMSLRLDEHRREIARARLQLVVDGVMAETLARLALDPRFDGVRLRPDGAGEGMSAVEELGPGVARVEVAASLGARRAAATAVVRLGSGPPRVVRFRRGSGEGAERRGSAGTGLQ